MAQPKKTLYEILGVPRDANPLDIGLAHERRVAEMRRIVPPDPSAEALVQQAYEILSSASRRAAYDAQLITAAERSAAAEQATTDLEIGEEEPPKRKLSIPVLAGIAVVCGVIAFFVFRAPSTPKPEPVAEAPKPAPPPPPKVRTAAEVLGNSATSVGKVMVYAMSGNATPIGLAVSTERGNMVTTCHGITAGGSLVVKVGKDQFPADLTITDEALDLCRLSLPGYATPPVKVSSQEPKAGDKVYTLALDAQGELTATEGQVKGMRGKLIELTTPVPTTATGAGVFDQYGGLLGIATAPHDQGANVHVAIPASSIAEMRTRTK